MIKFFRKIRQRLLSENRLGKYLIYAIGEIILVVIGILIAIQINNWNERRINEEKIVSLLQEIKKNLVEEIEDSEYVIEWYNRRDSLLQLVVTNKITRQDLESPGPHSPLDAITTWIYLSMNRNAYDNLILISSDIPSKYESLYEDLYDLYDYWGSYLLERKEKLYSKMTDFMVYLRYNQEWYSSLYSGDELDEKAISYYLENPFYKNHVWEYYDDAIKLQEATKYYKESAEIVYNKIIELEDE